MNKTLVAVTAEYDDMAGTEAERRAHKDARRAADVGTEDALAQEFARRHGDDYRYVPGLGWLQWTGDRWERDDRLRHIDAMRRITRTRAAEIEKDGESRRIASAKTVMAIATLARSDPILVRGHDELDADPLEINTPGGIVDLRTRAIRPHNRDLVTKITAVAPDFTVECPTFAAFLSGVFQDDDEIVGFVRRFLGYCLTGLTREHVIGFFFGDGANGKSTLLDLILWLLGGYALKLPASVLMAQRGERHPTELAQLAGVRMAVASELDEGEHWAEARLKELTGDTTLTARYVRGDFFTFALLTKIVIAGNHRPQMRAVDDALKRRLLLIPFQAKFTGARRDALMLGRLKAEGPGILAWLIRGCHEWQVSGLQVPDRILTVSSEYLGSMDSLGNWLTECAQLTGDPLDSDGASMLYRSYADWKRARGESAISQTRWGEQMRGRGFETYRNNGIRYRAVLLKPAERERIVAAAAQKDAA